MRRTPTTKPQPLQYAHLPTPPRWSPVPMMIASGIYGVLLTAIAYFLNTRFRQMCMDFKIELPQASQLPFNISSWMTMSYGWIFLMPVLILWPLAVIPLIPAPQQPESRSAIIRSTRYGVILIFILTVLGIFIAMLPPIVALIQAAFGPHKH